MPTPGRTCLRSTLKPILVIFCVLLGGSFCRISAGIRGPGKYSGVVIFDRWDTCLLISGPYVTYISETAKDGLRDHAGVAVQIDASSVVQPMNPGDALVQKYQLLGAAPEPEEPEDSNTLNGLHLQVKDDFGSEGIPAFVIVFTNHDTNNIRIITRDAGVTVMGNHKGPYNPSDGRSEAVITRADLHSDDWAYRWRNGAHKFHAAFKVLGRSVPETFQLKPGESKQFTIKVDLSPGEYQILIGYGGGVHEERSLISNAVSFDVSQSGKPLPVK